jgi:hypothetical protein
MVFVFGGQMLAAVEITTFYSFEGLSISKVVIERIVCQYANRKR